MPAFTIRLDQVQFEQQQTQHRRESGFSRYLSQRGAKDVVDIDLVEFIKLGRVFFAFLGDFERALHGRLQRSAEVWKIHERWNSCGAVQVEVDLVFRRAHLFVIVARELESVRWRQNSVGQNGIRVDTSGVPGRLSEVVEQDQRAQLP